MPINRSNPLQDQKIKAIAIAIGGLAFAYTIGQWILEGGLSGLTMNVLGIALGVVALLVVTRWRMGVFLFLGWLVFEDLPRKYLGNNMMIYFAKDALAAVVYVSFFISLKRQKLKAFRPPFWFALLAFFWLGVIQVFNPNSTSMFYGLLGLKLYFFYIPLLFIGYVLIESEEDLSRFLSFNLILAAVVSLVGIIQSLGAVDFLNPVNLAPELEALGHLTRESPITHEALNAPPSVFVSSGRFDSFLILMFILTLGAAGYQLLRPRPRGKFAYVAMGLISIAALLSGARSAIVLPLASALVLAIGLLRDSRYQASGRGRLMKAVRRSILAVSLAIVAIFVFFPKESAASWDFYYETLSPESPKYELTYRIRDYPMENFQQVFEYADWPMGYGMGTASLGTQYVSRILGSPAPPVVGVESGPGTLILEMGVLGPFLWYIWAGALVVSGWKVLRRLRGTTVYPVGLAILWYAFLLLILMSYGGIQTYENYIMNAYLWILLGILFKLPRVVGGKPPVKLVRSAVRTEPLEPALVGGR